MAEGGEGDGSEAAGEEPAEEVEEVEVSVDAEPEAAPATETHEEL